MRPAAVVKVEPVGLGLDADRVPLHAVLQDELLQEQERALVLDLLPHLDARGPLVGVGGGARARVAHVPVDDKLRHERLLKDGAVQNLLLDRELRLQALAVRLRPYETRVHELDLVQALDALDAERQELLALQIRADPMLGGLQVALALLAVHHRALLLDALGDVHLREKGGEGDDGVRKRVRTSGLGGRGRTRRRVVAARFRDDADRGRRGGDDGARTCERMQSTHIPAGLGGMPVPHMQHRTCPGACCSVTPNISEARPGPNEGRAGKVWRRWRSRRQCESRR